MPNLPSNDNPSRGEAHEAPRILIVEDEALVAADIEERLQRLGYLVTGIAQHSDEAIQQAVETGPDLVLMDINLGRGADGVATAKAIRQRMDVPFIYLTANSDHATVDRATKSGPSGYILKPFDDRTLEIGIQLALSKHAAERRIRQSERRFVATISSLADGVIATNPEGRVTFLNPTAERLTGWSLSQAAGRELREIFPALRPDTRQGDTEFFAAFLQICDSEIAPRIAVLPARGGEEAFIEYHAAYLYDDRHRYSGAVINFTDITERQRSAERDAHSQENLKKAHEDLRGKHDELQTFYHTVSHEVKTPLTSAREFISLTLEGLAGPVNDTQKEYLSMAQESCDQMRMCINDLLDTTRLDTGKLSLQTNLGSLGELAERIVLTLSPAAARKSLRLEAAVEPDLPAIPMDDGRIAQVFANLVNNAIKFTPQGGCITVAVARVQNDANFLEATVRDTGRGIPAEHLSRIFDRLYQVRAEDVSESKGMGLGLHICHELVSLHGGNIRVESEPNCGTTFAFRLPLFRSSRDA